MPKGLKTNVGNIPGTYDVGSSNYSVDLYTYDANKSVGRSFPDEKYPIDKFRKVWSLVTNEDEKNHLIVINNYFDTELLNDLKETLNLHSLSLEDIVNTNQRCKYDSYDTYDLFTVSKYEKGNKVQISILILKEAVIVFNPSKEYDESIGLIVSRIVLRKGRICERDLGYTAYAILDSLVDTYFVRLEELETEADELDQNIEKGSTEEIARRIFNLKREVLEFKKTTWPLREMANSMIRNEDSFLLNDARNINYYRDLQDHILRITENADALRDTVYSLVEMQMNTTSMRMNEIMKVLTILTAVFTPSMFLASIYGMNFDWIPEIHFQYGYIVFWLVIGTVTAIQIYLLKKKRWL